MFGDLSSGQAGQPQPVAAEAVAVGSEGKGTEAVIFNPAAQVCSPRQIVCVCCVRLDVL